MIYAIWEVWEKKGEVMVDFVKDRDFLKKSYSFCADLVNQLVQELKHASIETRMEIVGSGRHGFITQNGNEPIDYDFNLWIDEMAECIKGCELKNTIMETFDYVLQKNGFKALHCKDSASVITVGNFHLKEGNKTGFGIDLCIVKEDERGNWYRLIHRKTGIVQNDQWIWNKGPSRTEILKKEQILKPEHWMEVREAYLGKKATYLRQNIHTKPSFVCYIEAINDIYNTYYPNNRVARADTGCYSILGNEDFDNG